MAGGLCGAVFLARSFRRAGRMWKLPNTAPEETENRGRQMIAWRPPTYRRESQLPRSPGGVFPLPPRAGEGVVGHKLTDFVFSAPLRPVNAKKRKVD